MWNDNDTHVDFIDFSHLVDTSIKIIDNKDLVPCTIGFFGDWGSGKSSLIKMVEERYKGQENTLVIKFNGWLFEGYDDAKSVLMRTILEHVIKSKNFKGKAKDLAKKLYKQIDWMKLAKSATTHGAAFMLTGGIGNVALGAHDLLSMGKESVGGLANNFADGDYDKLIEEITKSSSSEKSLQSGIREFHEDFANLLKETKIDRLVVFIDDLDRCMQDTVIETLEAIKLFLFVPNSTFVICADERLIKYAVRKRFPTIQGTNAEVGRDYLEKLIQFPVRIPAMDNLEMETYINLLFCKLSIEPNEFEKIREKVMTERNKNLFSSVINSETLSNFTSIKIPEKLKQDLHLSHQITPILTVGLNGNPRQCKRFLNMLLHRLQMAKCKEVEIQQNILAKLMLLEYFKEQTFKTLSVIQAEQEGKPTELVNAELLLKNEEPKEKPDSKLDVTALVNENWFKKWFEMEPQLGGVDLRPYFYFSRDKLGVVTSETSRMSTQAQEAYHNLINESKSMVKKGVVRFKNLSEADANSVFSALSQKVKSEGNEDRAGEYLSTVVNIAGERPSLISELITYLESIPHSIIPGGLIPELLKATKNTAYSKASGRLIMNWSESENKILAALAKASIK